MLFDVEVADVTAAVHKDSGESQVLVLHVCVGP